MFEAIKKVFQFKPPEDVCNSCGANGVVRICPYCGTTPICTSCRSNHEAVCQQVQRRRGLGLGPTIRKEDAKEAPASTVVAE